jgi:glyoxylase-like metal-dependent hydrolase (beta-lactamase superfamily II)
LAKLILFLLLVVVLGALAGNVYRLTYKPPDPVRASVTHVRNGFVDFYGAKSGGRVLLFDTGCDPLGRALDGLLEALHASRDNVTDVFITHGHPDHLGFASLMKGARLHAGQGDVTMIDGTAGMEPWWARPISWIQPVAPAKITDGLSGPSLIQVGGGQVVRAIPLPGHTAGSYAFFWEGVLFVGDAVMYREGKLQPGPAFFTVDEEQGRRSLAGLPGALGGAKVEVICTGHSGCTPPGESKALLDDLVKRMGAS